MTEADIRWLVARAALAPSVHNVQPARWRFDGDRVTLFEDPARRLPACDPTGRDAAMSLGAAAEGMALALSERGLRMAPAPLADDPVGDLIPVRRFAILPDGTVDPLAGLVEARQSWRGAFSDGAVDGDGLAAEDVTVIADPAGIADVARAVDRAGLGFFRDPGFRTELLSWMRLRRSDPRWAVDGLNAQAMAMSRIEAAGAGVVMGRLFGLLDAIGLAGPLTAESTTIRSAAILLFHRPADEDRFESGRAFYRMWLRVTAAGLGGAVMASLADDPAAASRVAEHIPPGRTLVSALRAGRVPEGAGYPRARLPVDDLIV